jgi:hypothetical protein
MAKANQPTPPAAPPAPPAAKTETPEGFAVLYAPEGCTGCSFDGTEYEAEDGVVTVPVGAVLSLLDHGFTTSPKESK